MARRPRGSGSVRKRAGRGWEIRWGGRTEGGYRSRAEAERVLVAKRAEAMNRRAGHAADPRHTPTLGELAGPWLDRRATTHKAAAEDRNRWDKHLGPAFGRLRPDEVDTARIRAFVEAKRAAGLAPGTVRVMVSILSSLYVDLNERQLARANPARNLPPSLARLIQPDHDPRTTPFLERMEDVRRVYLRLDPPLSLGYALGALAGLRPGEAFALRWTSVDLTARRIHVREQISGRLKDRDSRIVPILDPLLPILTEARVRSGGTGLLCPPMRCDGDHVDKGSRGKAIRPVLRDLGLHALADYDDAWYAATRHTFASQWVMAGGSIEKLKEILGHYSVVMTERYAHLKPELFTAADHATLTIDMTAPAGAVAHLSGTIVGQARKRRGKTR